MNPVNNELITRILEADAGMPRTSPEWDQARPLTVALYGLVRGKDWRAPFKQTDMGIRPVKYYDPTRETWVSAKDPIHFIEETEHFHDDVRVMVIDDDAPGEESLKETWHILEKRMDKPFVVYIAEHMAPGIAAPAIETESNRWRSALLTLIAEMAQDSALHTHLYIADSPNHVIELTRALLSQWQPEAKSETS